MKTKINIKILIALVIMLLATCVFNMNIVQASEETDNSNLVYAWAAYEDKPTEEIGYVGSGFDIYNREINMSISTAYEPNNLYIYISTKNNVGNKISSTKGDFIYDKIYEMYNEKVYVYKLPLKNVIDNSYPNFEEFKFDIKNIKGNNETFNFYVSVDGERRKTIKLTGDTDTISINGNGVSDAKVSKIDETDKTYVEMLTNLYVDKNNYYIFAYDIEVSGDIYGNYVLSFDVGTQNNGKTAYVLHQKHDGKEERFKTVVSNGKVEITVSEFSPFMLAIEKTTEVTTEEKTEEKTNKEQNNTSTQNTETKDKGEKDNTPKTGTIEIIYYMLPITILAALGILTSKKKETK